MADTITARQIQAALTGLCDTIEEQKDYLSELDGAIGDGDHGVNMAKCFRGVKARLEASTASDVGGVLNLVGLEVMNSVGGAMGALYGTLFMRLALASTGKPEVTLDDLAVMFTGALEGILTIGQAQVGDKTLVDTLAPAVEALQAAARDGRSLAAALIEFEEAARKGMESTTNMLAKTGRASRLGERTLGHQDAGATSCYFILRALAGAAGP
ncbi:MAG: dihydroxyacetone kinase subunit DhaL [Thermodesulfobacteriota bacterium]